MKHANCTLGKLTDQGSLVGWAFRVIGEGDETLFWMTYPDKATATAAHDLMAELLEGADLTMAS
jgi:hypothetical protein